MNSLKRASEVLPLILELKECIFKETENSGKIKISQELLNGYLKKMILRNLDKIDDYSCNFHSGEITITKNVILLPLCLKLHSFNFICRNEQYKFIAKHKHSNIFYIVHFFDVLPKFISATKEQIEIDFTKIDGFEKLKNEGFFGIDVVNTVELEFLHCENGYLTFSYQFI